MRKLYIILLLFGIQTYADANPTQQFSRLKVGEAFPNFLFDNVEYSSKHSVSLNDFKGKWLILDFWTSYCASCISNFKKINNLKDEFSDNVEFLLVGCIVNDNLEHSRKVFERSKEIYNLNLPVLYDFDFFKKIEVNSYPYIVVIDPQGNINALTTSISRDFITNMISTNLEKSSIENNILAIDRNKHYKSQLSKWDAQQRTTTVPTKIRDGNEVLIQGVDLTALYNYAITGFFDTGLDNIHKDSYYSKFIFEIPDNKEFHGDKATGDRIYDYHLKYNRAVTRSELMEIMKNDLNKIFGFDVRIESRLLPCWEIGLIDNGLERLKTRRDSSDVYSYFDIMGITLHNQNINILVNFLNIKYKSTQPPFIDRTGFKGNIDLEIDAFTPDFSNVKEALELNGIIIKESKKVFNAIVVRK